MFCYKCGNQVSDNSKFCDNCGAQLLGVDDAPPAANRPSDPINYTPRIPVNRKSLFSRWWFWVVSIILILGVLGIWSNSGPDIPGSSKLENPYPATEDRLAQEEIESNKSEFSGVSIDTAIIFIESTLGKNFNNVKVYYDNGIIYVDILEDGIAASVLIALEGDSDYLKSWNDLVDSQIRLADSVCNLAQSLGLKDVSVVVNVLNDMNVDNVLLTVMDGLVIYDAVND